MSLGITDRWRTCYRWIGYFQALAAITLPFIGWAGKCEIPAGSTGIWYDFLSLLQDHFIVLLLAATLCLWGTQYAKAHYGDPWVCDLVKSLLDEMRADIFEGQVVFAHSDRVTLFKKRNWRLRFGFWPMCDWLCSIERSDHMNRKKRKWLRVENHANEWEGVGGTTWARRVTILKEGLPLISRDSPSRDIERYASETFVTPEYVRKQLAKKAVLPQSLCGIVVEVNHAPWGVIVIDSALSSLPQKEKIEFFFKKHANVLAKLLMRI